MVRLGELLKILSDDRRQPVERRLANMAVGRGQGVSRRVEAMYRTATWKPYEQGGAEQKQQESVHGLCPQPMGRHYLFCQVLGSSCASTPTRCGTHTTDTPTDH